MNDRVDTDGPLCANCNEPKGRHLREDGRRQLFCVSNENDGRFFMLKPEDCPEPSWHSTHRYCPICSYREEASKQTVATFEAVAAVRKGICTDDDLRAVLDLRAIRVEIQGQEYSLDTLSDAIGAAWRYALNRWGDDFAIQDAEWKKKHGC